MEGVDFVESGPLACVGHSLVDYVNGPVFMALKALLSY